MYIYTCIYMAHKSKYVYMCKHNCACVCVNVCVYLCVYNCNKQYLLNYRLF